jgi:hypothetical protein
MTHDQGVGKASVVEDSHQVVGVPGHPVRAVRRAAAPAAQIRCQQRHRVTQLIGQRLEIHVRPRQAMGADNGRRATAPPADPKLAPRHLHIEDLICHAVTPACICSCTSLPQPDVPARAPHAPARDLGLPRKNRGGQATHASLRQPTDAAIGGSGAH